MLTDEQMAVLPDWVAPIAVDLEWRCRHEQYAVGRDVSNEARRLQIILAYADALLARQRLERQREAMRVTVTTVCNGLKSITRDALSVMDTQVALHAEMLRKDLAAAFADQEAKDVDG